MKSKYILLIAGICIGLTSCFKEPNALEKGAGYYTIEEKIIQTFDSSLNLIQESKQKNYGSITLLAKSGGISSARLRFNGQTLAYGGDTLISTNWEVIPGDNSRISISRIFTMKGWGTKNLTLTFLSNIRDREIYKLKRN